MSFCIWLRWEGIRIVLALVLDREVVSIKLYREFVLTRGLEGYSAHGDGTASFQHGGSSIITAHFHVGIKTFI